MLPRALLLRRLNAANAAAHLRSSVKPARLAVGAVRYNSNASTSPGTSKSSSEPAQKPSWLTRQIESSPAAKSAFLGFAKVLGYGSPKQLAARRAFVLYEKIAAMKPDEDKAFWLNDCYLPPTFQSWFTVTNLHVWLLTVRLRALPAEHGRHYQQALIDHFFIDVEDRVRAVLQPRDPQPEPYTFESSFYLNPNALPKDEAESGEKRKRKLSRAPDRIVTRQMKIFKEQWAGLGLAFDLALVQGDQELAAAIWRNLLGARGAQGIEYPAGTAAAAQPNPSFRRTVNLVGGEVVNVEKVDFEKEATTDDNSGVHDFPPTEVDKYLTYPQVMLDLTTYIRQELARLDKVSDHDIMEGDWEKLRFTRVTEDVKEKSAKQ
ncbi:hypothetical protein EST38_g8851 [Candolleomyces aberdarensis]|uniref:Ubiquinol-cytochrome c chaperone domain-containing protein n=1 Tax=Candolleomyces aberdarensis TaxID=2316362 RepID=A0A4Q2DEC6_9AGAR|nr:hypothetical protein EST38_g8851 [Candolleomyces aberdarensis]